MDLQKAIIAIIGLAITVLSTLGVINADEGASLTAHGTAVATGILGLVSTITAIVKRRKGGKAAEGGEDGGDV